MPKLKKSEMKPFKEMLLQMRAQLRGDVTALADAALTKSSGASGSSSVPSHIADLGSDTFDQDNSILLMNNEGETLSQIEAALERIESGEYGFCVECGGKIPKMRLNTIPFTPYCVKCASKLESEQY